RARLGIARLLVANRDHLEIGERFVALLERVPRARELVRQARRALRTRGERAMLHRGTLLARRGHQIRPARDARGALAERCARRATNTLGNDRRAGPRLVCARVAELAVRTRIGRSPLAVATN